MISLRSILLEVYGSPKAIILSGAAGIGKSTFADLLTPHIPSNFKTFNPDTFNPEDDPKKPNISKNSKVIRTQAIPNAIENKESFIYDTTGQNFEETAKIILDAQKAGFKVMVIMFYGSPIINFLRNFSRERKLPKDVVLDNWAKVYRNIQNYKSIPGIEFILVQTELSPAEREEANKFEEALKSKEIEEYFKTLIATDPERFRSSFRKPKDSEIEKAEDLPDTETLKAKEEKKKAAEKKFSDVIKNLKDQFKEVEKYLKIIKPIDYKTAIGTVKTFAKP